MKHIFVFLFLILVSCSTSNKTYLCGDRVCVDKKEFKEHFAKNLTIEIQSKKNKRNSSIDLVKLNLPEETLGNKKKVSNTETENEINKKQKISLKLEKRRLQKERKTKKIEAKKRAKLNKKQKKLDKVEKNENKKINYIKTINNKDKFIESVKATNKKVIKTNNVNKNFKSVKSMKQVSICNDIKDCDIDKITELLSNKSKNKDFPNINAK